MAIRVNEIIDEILPSFDEPEGIESFYKTSNKSHKQTINQLIYSKVNDIISNRFVYQIQSSY